MTQIREGDFILHNSNGKLVAISIARKDCRCAEQPQELINANTSVQWDNLGYRVDTTEYFVFDNPVIFLEVHLHQREKANSNTCAI